MLQGLHFMGCPSHITNTCAIIMIVCHQSLIGPVNVLCKCVCIEVKSGSLYCDLH